MKRLVCLIMIIILLIIPTYVFSFELSATPEIVKSNTEFEFKISVNPEMYLANGILIYDSNFFEFIKSSTPNIELEKIEDGKYKWIYVNEEKKIGIDSIVFEFKSPSVAKDEESSIEVQDYIFIDFDENIYESKSFSKNIKVSKRDVWDLPMTGGNGYSEFIVLGFGVMMISIVMIKKNNKK